MKGINVISVIVVIAMVQFMGKGKPWPGAEAAVTCEEVTTTLAPCMPYLTKQVAGPSDKCCNGVGNVQKMAQTTADKQAACNCAKDAAARLPTIQEDAAASLPAKCNIQVSFPISRTTNCQDIH